MAESVAFNNPHVGGLKPKTKEELANMSASEREAEHLSNRNKWCIIGLVWFIIAGIIASCFTSVMQSLLPVGFWELIYLIAATWNFIAYMLWMLCIYYAYQSHMAASGVETEDLSADANMDYGACKPTSKDEIEKMSTSAQIKAHEENRKKYVTFFIFWFFIGGFVAWWIPALLYAVCPAAMYSIISIIATVCSILNLLIWLASAYFAYVAHAAITELGGSNV